jgi:hypothetical protein
MWTGFAKRDWCLEQQNHTTKRFAKWCGRCEQSCSRQKSSWASRKSTSPGTDFTSAKQMASSALDVVEQGRLGYALITAEKPE